MFLCDNHSLRSCGMKNNDKIKSGYLYISAILPITGKHYLHTFLICNFKGQGQVLHWQYISTNISKRFQYVFRNPKEFFTQFLHLRTKH